MLFYSFYPFVGPVTKIQLNNPISNLTCMGGYCFTTRSLIRTGQGATLKHTLLQILQIYKYLQYVFITNKKLQILQIFVKFANI